MRFRRPTMTGIILSIGGMAISYLGDRIAAPVYEKEMEAIIDRRYEYHKEKDIKDTKETTDKK